MATASNYNRVTGVYVALIGLENLEQMMNRFIEQCGSCGGACGKSCKRKNIETIRRYTEADYKRLERADRALKKIRALLKSGQTD